MEAFAAGGADVLVATTVIEVGIDVPNATVMLVEDAERYGISQLHQLRGRVGRGEHPSLCLLFGPKESPRLAGARAAHGRLPPGRDRPRAARRGRAHRHAPVGPGELPRRPAARRRASCSTAPARWPSSSSPAIPSSRSPSTRCWATRWPRPTARPAPRRSRREDRRRAPSAGAGCGRPAVRPRGRRPTGCARRSSRCSGRSTTRACSTCSRARARSGSRRSRAAPRSAVFVERAHSALAVLRAQPGGARARPGGGADPARRRAPRPCATHAPPPRHTIWSSSTLRTGLRPGWAKSSARAWRACSPPARAS